MNKKRVRKSVVYKKAEIAGLTQKKSLSQLIAESLKVFSKPSQRRESLGSAGEDSGVRRVIGSTDEIENMLFGTVLLYEVGKDVTFVVEDDDAEEFIIESQNPAVGTEDESDKKRREVLQSALYFGVLDNHVVLVQSHALKSRDLESHLGWLLTSANIISDSVAFSLSDEPTVEARKKLNNLPVKSVEIGTPVETKPINSQGAAGVNSIQTTTSDHRLTGRAKDFIKSLLGEGFVNSLDLPTDLNDSNLEIVLQLRYKRKTTDSGHKALDHIARAMRHAEPEDTKVITSSGTVIHGNELKLTGHVNCDSYNGVPDAKDLYNQMFTWLEERVKEGSIG
ncbi:Uncharacterised protein [Plesiomonas shigelloides]|uniref:hypothetical protein n=1 Tax=Plesiomonas shigelloides TaxID=703 RepID=UPI0007ECDA13|nr:hypothetical protein [Plesiomonas shigelloides]SBT60904.1 Uncharacterised protein [Plesiomonas shigelloides]